MLLRGDSPSQVARALGVPRSTVRGWIEPPHGAPSACPRHDNVELTDHVAYAALLGYYLGDGCISSARRAMTLRITCDRSWPAIIEDVASLMSVINPRRPVHRVSAPGAIVLSSGWKHWPCLFPQHGPGPKHERPIVLETWQREIVTAHPAPFLRGLFHSDGARVRNWATRTVAGERKRYDYPRWQFVNYSGDIRDLCCWALDLVDVPWRQSTWHTISVSTRAGVAELDRSIGLKM